MENNKCAICDVDLSKGEYEEININNEIKLVCSGCFERGDYEFCGRCDAIFEKKDLFYIGREYTGNSSEIYRCVNCLNREK